MVAPTSATDTDAARDEVFGPVVAVLEIADYDDGLATINDSAYGLTAGICTRDPEPRVRVRDQAQAGSSRANRPTTGLDLNVPFGGVKDSSTNTFREQGPGRRFWHLVQDHLSRANVTPTCPNQR